MINDADRAMATPSKHLARVIRTKYEEHVALGGTVQHVLPTVLPGWRHAHFFPGCIPVIAGNHGPAVRSKSDQNCIVVSVSLAGQLSNVDHSLVGHVSGPSIADVRVVLPDDRLGVSTVVLQQA